MEITVRQYKQEDLDDLIRIWNEVVEEGAAFPQEDYLDRQSGADFFASQTYTAAAEADGRVLGLYILHPNNVGRCGHICNASYAVDRNKRGKRIGEALVKDCMKQAKKAGFSILQFNAVVASNQPALHLYKKLGFIQLGVIKKGFRNKEGVYEDIIPHYISLENVC